VNAFKVNADGKLPFTTKFFYGAGDIFGGGALILIGFYYLFFLTEVAGLNPVLAGLVLMLGKGWDAISDPLMGFITDQTRSRFGRRRVYFLAGILPIIITFTLLWSTPAFETQFGLFLFFLVMNILFNTTLTMVMVPYNALIPELTPSYNERSSLTGFRMAFSNLSSLASAAVPMLIVGSFDQTSTGYTIMGITFGLIFALPLVGTFLVSFEQPHQHVKTKLDLIKDVKDTMTNRCFRTLTGIYLLTFLAIDVISAVLMYYMTYVIGRGEEIYISLVFGILLLVQTLSLLIYVPIANRYGKKTSYYIGTIIWILLVPVLAIVGEGTPIWVIFVIAGLIGLGTSGAAFSPWSMLPDVLDVDQLATGKRRQGTYAGVMTFLRKLSTAIALMIVGWVIQFSGYTAPQEGIATVQPDSFILAVRLLVSLAPILLLLISLFGFARHYNLTCAVHGQIQSILERRKEDEPVGEDETTMSLIRLLYNPNYIPTEVVSETGEDETNGS